MLVATLVVAGCMSSGSTGGDSAAMPTDANGSRLHSGIVIRDFGIAVTLPAGWDGRAFLATPGRLPVVHAATFRLPPSDGELEFGRAATRMMSRNDVRIRLVELPSTQVGTHGFTPATLPVAIRRSDAGRSSWIPRQHAYASRRFAVRGRAFSLGVEFGTRAPSERQVTAVNRVVASLAIEARPELDPRQWRPLHRRLHLPTVSAGATCPRSRAARTTARVTWPLGPGPAYPALGSANGVADLTDDIVRDGWYLHKTLWAVGPGYRGPLLIRGGRVDAAGAVRFQSRLSPQLKLHELPAEEPRRWRYVPSYTAVRSPGCYALQVDGSRFSLVLVFEARRRA